LPFSHLQGTARQSVLILQSVNEQEI